MSFMLADMAMGIEAARLAVYKVCVWLCVCVCVCMRRFLTVSRAQACYEIDVGHRNTYYGKQQFRQALHICTL